MKIFTFLFISISCLSFLKENTNISHQKKTTKVDLTIGRRAGCSGSIGVCSFNKAGATQNSELLESTSENNFKAEASKTPEGDLKLNIHKGEISALIAQNQFKKGFFNQLDTLELSGTLLSTFGLDSIPIVILPGYYPIKETEMNYELTFKKPLSKLEHEIELEKK